ncbi:MAG: DivIVA domain-containing protein, partial [Nocardioidaceae bacterium]
MTLSELTENPAPISRFPTSVRQATFTTRAQGWDETEVRAYLDNLAEEIQAADADRAALRAEIKRLRAGQPGTDGHESINAQVVGLFSQAQEV